MELNKALRSSDKYKLSGCHITALDIYSRAAKRDRNVPVQIVAAELSHKLLYDMEQKAALCFAEAQSLLSARSSLVIGSINQEVSKINAQGLSDSLKELEPKLVKYIVVNTPNPVCVLHPSFLCVKALVHGLLYTTVRAAWRSVVCMFVCVCMCWSFVCCIQLSVRHGVL